jgi:hypothetical protein
MPTVKKANGGAPPKALNYKPIEVPILEGAACMDIPNVMDGNNLHDVIDALGTCADCPVLMPCREWVNGLSNHQKRNTLNGVVGGKVWGEAKRWLTAPQRQRNETGELQPGYLNSWNHHHHTKVN